MGRKVARGLRGKSAVVAGDGEDRNRPSPNPSRKREGSKIGDAAVPRIKFGVHGRGNPLMPGLRIREDGFTVARTRTFLALLAQTGCVTDAARVAGVSRTSVNRSRKLFAPFDKACRDALAKALRGLEAVAYARAVEGREMVVIRDGKEVERRIVPSDSLLAMLLKRGDLKNGRDVRLTPEEAKTYELPEAVRHRFLSREEYFSGMVFDKHPGTGKVQGPTQEETDAVLIKRIEMVRRYERHQRRIKGQCLACGQPMMLSQYDMDARERAKAEQRLLPSPQDGA